MNLGGDGQGASGVVTDVLRNTDDDAVDPHLERIKNQAGDEESDEEVCCFVMLLDASLLSPSVYLLFIC
jgi:structure-specific recognition protein 1